MRDLRGNYILSLNKPKTTSYGLNFFSYVSAKREFHLMLQMRIARATLKLSLFPGYFVLALSPTVCIKVIYQVPR